MSTTANLMLQQALLPQVPVQNKGLDWMQNIPSILSILAGAVAPQGYTNKGELINSPTQNLAAAATQLAQGQLFSSYLARKRQDPNAIPPMALSSELTKQVDTIVLAEQQLAIDSEIRSRLADIQASGIKTQAETTKEVSANEIASREKMQKSEQDFQAKENKSQLEAQKEAAMRELSLRAYLGDQDAAVQYARITQEGELGKANIKLGEAQLRQTSTRDLTNFLLGQGSLANEEKKNSIMETQGADQLNLQTRQFNWNILNPSQGIMPAPTAWNSPNTPMPQGYTPSTQPLSSMYKLPGEPDTGLFSDYGLPSLFNNIKLQQFNPFDFQRRK